MEKGIKLNTLGGVKTIHKNNPATAKEMAKDNKFNFMAITFYTSYFFFSSTGIISPFTTL